MNKEKRLKRAKQKSKENRLYRANNKRDNIYEHEKYKFDGNNWINCETLQVMPEGFKPPVRT